MGILKKFTRISKNRKYDYKPRFYDDKGKGNPFKIESKFDKFRSTVDTPRGIKGKFNSAIDDMKTEGDRNMKMRLIIILAVLILVFLYIIDFDISIFYKR
ncbi:riboflavin synthase subunit beta [Maribacter sp. TH_r10]|uniref:Riboflavin synthase subunit beta n=1 Tax=Maribacter luteus TaxID=2594478 RepID=A0A6I2MRH1_9FLAO|nr:MULTISPECIES: riboflavin synthase subunit beta [Maribacter]MDV7140024.1 riboflavin synthase subunit beta [Maribacter sp. TH_r10]MRX63856.1 riboflavin synthase subunit beta [Maribacter luteus]|tara:strand:+ start:4602 stop:4901 length:300 start_codon:yes stop_codon:yes gene_type:complete